MTDDLTTLLHDTAARVPTRLHPAADLRRNAQHHQRVRRTGAAVLAVFLLAGAIGISANFGGGRDHAAELPANQPLSEKMLIVPDEVNAWGDFSYETTKTKHGEEPSPPASCLQGEAPMKGLGALDVWSRSFESDASVYARQVAAQFSSEEAANRAFTAIQTWYRNCRPAGIGERRWPTIRVPGGQAETVFGGSLGLTSDDPDSGEYAFTSYGVLGRSVTVITVALIGQDANIFLDPVGTTMMFALERLAGRRDVAENEIPAGFQIAEERTDDAGWRGSPAVHRIHTLTEEWVSSPCLTNELVELRGARASDGLRTGMLTVRRDEPDLNLTRQVGTYQDEKTARAVAQELRAEYERCASRSDDSGEITWTTQATETNDTTVHWSRNVSTFEGETNIYGGAVAIGQRGNAVVVADGSLRSGQQPAADSAAVNDAVAAAKANLDVVCEVADCD